MTGEMPPAPPTPATVGACTPVLPPLLLQLTTPLVPASQANCTVQDDGHQVAGLGVRHQIGGIAMETDNIDRRNLENGDVARPY